MQDQMILYNGPNSPFGRKTKITALVQEINLEEIINSFKGEYRPSELAKIISDQTGFSKNIIYNKIIKLKEEN